MAANTRHTVVVGMEVEYGGWARNGSGMDENQHNLVKMLQKFDASPAVTTGMPQDPYFEPFRVETARSAAWGASSYRHWPGQ